MCTKYWHRPHIDNAIFIDFKHLNGVDYIYEVKVDMVTKKAFMTSKVNKGCQYDWLSKNSRNLVIAKRNRTLDRFLNRKDFHEQCVSINCRLFVSNSERKIDFFKNIDWLINESKARRLHNLSFESYRDIPYFSKSKSLLENQIPLVEEWRFLASASLLEKSMNHKTAPRQRKNK